MLTIEKTDGGGRVRIMAGNAVLHVMDADELAQFRAAVVRIEAQLRDDRVREAGQAVAERALTRAA